MFVVFAPKKPAITPWFAVELRSALLDSYPSHGGKQLDSVLETAVVIPCCVDIWQSSSILL